MTLSFVPQTIVGIGFLISAVLATGCLTRTVVGADETGGAGGATNTSPTSVTSVVASGHSSTASGPAGPATTSTGVATTAKSAVAIRAADLPLDAQPCGSLCPQPSDMLYLFLDSDGNSCALPRGLPNETSSNWQRIIGLPTAYQAVGMYSLSDPSIFVAQLERIVAPSGPASASGTGGLGFFGGTLEIVSIDEKDVVVKLTNVSTNLPDENGELDAHRCLSAP